jgi:hypothetical protein
MYYLVVFVPTPAAEGLLEALFAAGAGTMGVAGAEGAGTMGVAGAEGAGTMDKYDRCAFILRGQGRFRPLPGSSPAIGSPPGAGEPAGRDEFVDETRLELLVPGSSLDAVRAALLDHHPYEEPAYYFIEAML